MGNYWMLRKRGTQQFTPCITVRRLVKLERKLKQIFDKVSGICKIRYLMIFKTEEFIKQMKEQHMVPVELIERK